MKLKRTEKIVSSGSINEVYYMGIDNGVSGSYAVLDSRGASLAYVAMPVVLQQDYTKKRQSLNRIDHASLLKCWPFNTQGARVRVFIERPMVNPGRFRASTSALRALEAVLVVVEQCGFPVYYLDSKEWQREFHIKGDTKLQSASYGKQLFPQLAPMITQRKESDALLIAEYARRKRL